MAFQQQPAVSQQPQVKELRLILTRSTQDIGLVDGAIYRIAVTDQNGTQMVILRGDLAPHLTATQKTKLQEFVADMWAKAEAEITPEE